MKTPWIYDNKYDSMVKEAKRFGWTVFSLDRIKAAKGRERSAGREIYFGQMMKRGLRGMKEKIRRIKQPLASAQDSFCLRDPDILQCKEIESHL